MEPNNDEYAQVPVDSLLYYYFDEQEIINIKTQVISRLKLNQIIEKIANEMPYELRPSIENFIKKLNSDLDKIENSPNPDANPSKNKGSNFESISKQLFIIQTEKNKQKSLSDKKTKREHPKKWNYLMQVIRDFRSFIKNLIYKKPKKINSDVENFDSIIKQNVEEYKEFIDDSPSATKQYRKKYFSKSLIFQMFQIFVENFYKLADGTDSSFNDQNSTRLSKHYKFSCCLSDKIDGSFNHQLDCYSKWEKLKKWTLDDARKFSVIGRSN